MPYFAEHPLANPLRVAFAYLREVDDSHRDGFLDSAVAV